MHRRRLLAVSAAGLLGMAGCTTGEDEGTTPTDTSPTDSPATDTPTPTPTSPQPSVTVERTRVLPSLVAMDTPDSVDVVGESWQRYVLVSVDASGAGDPPARDEFTLSAGGESHAPETAVGYGEGLTYFHALGAGIYGADDPSGDLPFPVPTAEDAGAVRLSWPGGERVLDGAGDALARPSTTFTVDSFTAEITDRGTVGLSVTVRNTGDHAGWFVGAINRRGPSVAVRPVTGAAVEVAPGETGEWSYADDTAGGAGDGGQAEYTLQTGSGTLETTVEVGGQG